MIERERESSWYYHNFFFHFIVYIESCHLSSVGDFESSRVEVFQYPDRLPASFLLSCNSVAELNGHCGHSSEHPVARPNESIVSRINCPMWAAKCHLVGVEYCHTNDSVVDLSKEEIKKWIQIKVYSSTNFKIHLSNTKKKSSENCASQNTEQIT